METQWVPPHFGAKYYGLGDQGHLNVITDTGKTSLGTYTDGIVQLELKIVPLDVFVVEVRPIR